MRGTVRGWPCAEPSRVLLAGRGVLLLLLSSLYLLPSPFPSSTPTLCYLCLLLLLSSRSFSSLATLYAVITTPFTPVLRCSRDTFSPLS